MVITSCGTYQYSGNINDGIYNASDSYANEATDNEVNNKSNSNNDYYKAAFSEKSLMYSESEPDNDITDIENYRTTDNDSIENNYGQWGEYKDSVVINIHSYNNDGLV